jgi:tetratricopeptide (TPR) repeat protein
MIRSRILPLAMSLLVIEALPIVARAAEPAVEAKAEARSRFDRGLALFNDGDNPGALAEFQRAYEVMPNPVVLYNIGLVYAAMNRPAEAADTLDRVLGDPRGLSGDRLERARRTREEQAARIAKLELSTSVPATIAVDNVEVGKTPLAAPLRVAGGSHIVEAIAAGYAPARKEVTVAGGRSATLELKLVTLEGRLAHLAVRSHVPAADVLVDGEVVGRTPLASSLSLAPGTRNIEVRRAGYTTARQSLTLGEGATGEIALDPEEDAVALRRDASALVPAVSETQAMVFVDAKPRGIDPPRIALAPGLHRVRIERGGFEPLERDVEIAPAAASPMSFVLDPTPETRADFVGKTHSQRTYGWVAVAAGGAVVAGGLGYFLLNQSSESDAQSAYDAASLVRSNQTGICDTRTTAGDADRCNATVQSASDDLQAAKRRSTIALIGAGAGVVIAGVGAFLLLSSDDPHRYDRKSKEELARVRWVPRGGFAPGGGWAGLEGSF